MKNKWVLTLVQEGGMRVPELGSLTVHKSINLFEA